jgi:hypothetical protein
MRRRYQHQPVFIPGETGKRGQEQAQLADALPIGKQLGERCPGPATTRKLGVQLGKAGGNALDRDFGVLVAAPDGGVLQDEIEGRA